MWNHPRRPSKEIVSYLVSLSADISRENIIDEEDAAAGLDKQELLENVLEELKSETASAMQDKNGSVVMESLMKLLNRKQLEVVLKRCTGYLLSLATNRYSSHVLQTLFSLVPAMVEEELTEVPTKDTSTADPDERGLPNGVIAAVLLLAKELSDAWSDLAADVSGSHTARAIISALCGIPYVAEKRGRHSAYSPKSHTNLSRKRHRATPAADGVDAEASSRWLCSERFAVPISFEEAVNVVGKELVSLPAAALQQMACDLYGGPFLVLLLQMFANQQVPIQSTQGKIPSFRSDGYGMQLVVNILDWKDEERSQDIVYAISGESTGSHFMEAVIWLCPKVFFESLWERCFIGRAYEYGEHVMSNYLVQALLGRVESRKVACALIEELNSQAQGLLAANRLGVLWKVAQACVRLKLGTNVQRSIITAIANAVVASKDISTDGQDDDQLKQSTWVPSLLALQLPSSDRERLTVNVPGARIIQNLLSFDQTLAAPIMSAVVELPKAALQAIAKDNLSSRCLIDPVLEGNANSNEVEGILQQLQGSLVSLACDKVGAHCVMKLFGATSTSGRRAIVQELASSDEAIARMASVPSGRDVLRECMVERYRRSIDDWKRAMDAKESGKRQERPFAQPPWKQHSCEGEKEASTSSDTKKARRNRSRGKGRGKRGEDI